MLEAESHFLGFSIGVVIFKILLDFFLAGFSQDVIPVFVLLRQTNHDLLIIKEIPELIFYYLGAYFSNIIVFFLVIIERNSNSIAVILDEKIQNRIT